MSGKKLDVQCVARDDLTWIYTLVGDLYSNTEGYGFQEEVRGKIAGGAKGIIIDLAGVKRIDSSGIGILVAVMWSASNAGGRLVLAALSPKVHDVLSIAMLLDHIDHADSKEEALAKLDAALSA
jgi:anti-sigma B factor antagonist